MTDKTMTPAPTPTPRTDAFLANPCRDPWGLDADDVLRLIDFARTLERELAAAKQALALCQAQSYEAHDEALRPRPGVDAEPVVCEVHGVFSGEGQYHVWVDQAAWVKLRELVGKRAALQAIPAPPTQGADVHSDHPARHYDHTCPACNIDIDQPAQPAEPSECEGCKRRYPVDEFGQHHTPNGAPKGPCTRPPSAQKEK